MVINWSILLPATALLLYPLDRLLPDYMKCRTGDALADPAARHRRKWWRWQPELWIDVVRIGAAAWFVNFALVRPLRDSHALPEIILGAILVAGLCSQMFTRREEDSILAPLSYLLGAMFALLPVSAVLATFALAAAALFAFRSYLGFFLTGMLLVAELTWLLGGKFALGIVVAVLHLVPILVCFMSERELVLPVRSRVEGKRVPVAVR